MSAFCRTPTILTDYVYCLRSQTSPQHFLLDLVPTVLDDSLHLLVDQFYTAEAGLLQSLDLSLDQQLEADLFILSAQG